MRTKINDPYNTMGTAHGQGRKKATRKLNEQGRRAQAQCLRRAGYGADAELVEKGLVEFDADWLESLKPNSAPKGYPQHLDGPFG